MLVPLLFATSKIDDVIYKISFIPFPSLKGNQKAKNYTLKNCDFN